jgi:hypothetical protein
MKIARPEHKTQQSVSGSIQNGNSVAGTGRNEGNSMVSGTWEGTDWGPALVPYD